jgi:outer membrane protein
MKKSVQSLLALAAFGFSALLVRAEPAPKILVVDLASLYDSHYKTEEQNTKLRGDEQKAQEELDRLNKEGNSLVEKYKDMVDQSNNPAATADAKAKAQAESNRMLEDIRRKKSEVESFQANTRNSLQQRIKTFRDLMIEEISKIAVDVAKRKGATLLIDKSGPTLIGVSNVLYSDAGYDITADVLAEINRDRPAAAAAPAAKKDAAPSSDSPKITLPGVTPAKTP